MSTEHLDARTLLASDLVTAIDHIGIAVPNLDEAIAWYNDFLGMIVVHEEINIEQGVREAMLAVRGAAAGSAQIQLMAPLDDTCTIAKFLDKRGPGIQQLACRVCVCCTTSRDMGRRILGSISSIPRMPVACWSNSWSQPSTDLRTTCG